MPKDDSKKTKTVEETYKKMSQHEHVLHEPDNYIGSIYPDEINMWIYDEEKNYFVQKTVVIPPGLYKIFDEILVNARDQTIVDKTCRTIKVTINQKKGQISVWNDGKGIPVEIHKEHNVYVPDLIFSNLLTSSNYATKKKTVGGKNGIGAKAANIFSKEFIVETLDSNNHKKFIQKYKNNMFDKEKPVVETVSKSETSYTKITFTPDYERFELPDGMSDDILGVFKRRIYDIAATSEKNVKVYLNDKLLEINNFTDYINMYYSDPPTNLIFQKINDRWKVGVVYDRDVGHKHISFVNGISTFRGGTHVDYIVKQLVEELTKKVLKHDKTLKVKPDTIKTNITVFVDSVIEDPSFNSQTKEELTKRVSDFGSKCIIPDSFIDKLSETGIVDEIIRVAQFKQLGELKKTDGKKVASVKTIEKLEDAKWAGTRKSDETLLILTEGDSARAFAFAGLEVIGNEKYGVFPLKGKLLNVRNAQVKQLKTNKEFIALKQILGLKQGANYKSTKELRYGGILILTDADADGSHIKGLIINMFEHFWPSLIVHNGFIKSYNTPLLKATKKKSGTVKTFYSLPEVKSWIENDLKGDTKGWDIKYYKGLGTHTESEAKECFKEFEDRVISYIWEKGDFNKHDVDSDDDKKNDDIEESEKSKKTDDKSDDKFDDKKLQKLNKLYKGSKSHDAITLAFDEGRVNDRKKWITNYDPDDTIDSNAIEIPYSEFINKELKIFSHADIIRSIPCITDGLKPSQRKILFAMFLRGKKAPEIKVSQFAGFIALKTEYHHGEDSLNKAIIGMAQNFTGSNNINLINPNGNFGYRRMAGKDHASPRYIFTQLNTITTKLFREEDMPLLDYLEEEGTEIEPKTYYPILPTVLINGADGIGTGYSTKIPNYDAIDVAKYIKNLINNKQTTELVPSYRGYKGKIEKTGDGEFKMHGIYEIIDENTVKISEIPLYRSTSTESYKQYLLSISLIDKKDADDKSKYIQNFHMEPFNNKVDITITFRPNILQKLLKNGDLEKILKMTNTITISNLVLLDNNNLIRQYDNAESIAEDFFNTRLQFYKLRKLYIIKVLENDMNIAKYRIKYINDILNKKIIIERNKKANILKKLKELKYPLLSISLDTKKVIADIKKKWSKSLDDVDIDDDKSDISEDSDIELDDMDDDIIDVDGAPKEISKIKKSYKYLTDLPLFSLTDEKINELNELCKQKEKVLSDYRETKCTDMWKKEIDEFIEEYTPWEKKVEELQNSNINKKQKKTKTKTKK